MKSKRTTQIDPMLEGHPEPFSEPRTIPTGWDLSEMFSRSARPEITKENFDELLLLIEDEDLPQDPTL